MGVCILRLPEVKRRTGLSRSALYLRMANNQFPKQIRLGVGRAVGWADSQIEEWIQQQIQQRQISGKKRG